jgi:hypothetical protein
MSYGQDLPNGLVAIKYLNGAQWNGQVSPYLISPAYNKNIAQGDLVYMGADGYIKNWQGDTPAQGALGVFAGCSYSTTTAANPVDPSSPGRPYWPASTTTLNSVPAIAFVIDDPNTIFEIQARGAAGFVQADMGACAPVIYDTTSTYVSGNPQLNASTGVSLMALDHDSIATTATLPLKMIRLSDYPDNVANTQYNNAEVIIQHHTYCSRPQGV